MPDVFVVADNVYTPIGKTTAENFSQLRKGVSGIRQHEDKKLSDIPFYASLFNEDIIIDNKHELRYSKFERLLIASVAEALSKTNIRADDKDTVLIISSTKGNIGMLEEEAKISDLQHRISIPYSAKLIVGYFGFVNQPVVVSNACISGIVAIITGMRLIRAGKFKHAVVAGADVVSKFILSGFQSFQAVSSEPCKPFDADRTGITLGEGSATIILSSGAEYKGNISIQGGSISNDANHISAPSRTGRELNQAIQKTLAEAGLNGKSVDLISAHGTATLYNDEMEAKAITLAGMQNIPLNSLKGYYGHTLGAAGLIESIISMKSILEGTLIPTKGFKTMGVRDALNIIQELKNGKVSKCLKTASGFGGCNAALLFAAD